MTDSLFHVDAFTSVPFGGNPAAVVLLGSTRDDAWLQSLAAELNLSETAYPQRRPDGGWDLRWFTPTVEVDLCGHATLASAHVLWSTGAAPNDSPLHFHTRSGELTVQRLADGRIELDFPSLHTNLDHLPDAVAEALGLFRHEVHHAARHTAKYWLIVLPDAESVRRVQPDFRLLRACGDDTYVVTAPADDSVHDIVSRYFAPAYGIDEDPATGAAHCVVAPYWSQRLARPVLRCHQASARGADIECEPRGDRVMLRGEAVTVLEGAITI